MFRKAFRMLAATVLTASATPPSAPQPPTPLLARVLAAQNRMRAEAGVPPLVWDNSLATGATEWAQHEAATGIFLHSDRHARRGIGENLWYGSHGSHSPEEMVALWGSEKRNFLPGVYPNISRTGNWYDVSHYTQVIWRTTTRVGCALASNARTDYLVCRFAPAGNIDGRRLP